MKEYKRDTPIFSLCGLNCGLCPRFNIEGASKCPGCGGAEFHLKHPSCKVINCNLRHESVEYCFLCSEYPCEKYKVISETDSFISYLHVIDDFEKAKALGIEGYIKESERKVDMLGELLRSYNDGRKKSFYCNAVDLLPLKNLKKMMEELRRNEEVLKLSVKDRAKKVVDMIDEISLEKGISLKLRK